MRRITARSIVTATAFALVLTACSGGESTETTQTTAVLASEIETTTTTEAVVVTTSSTTTTIPGGPPIAQSGDKNETVEAIQFVLNCGNYGDLTVDGSFGPATQTAIEAAQTALGRAVTGAPDDETFAELSRACSQSRQIPGDNDGVFTLVGNAGPSDPEIFRIPLLKDSVLSITVVSGMGDVKVISTEGEELMVEGQGTWNIEDGGTYLIEVNSTLEGPSTFSLTVNVTAGEIEVGAWIIAGDGVTYQGTELGLGDDAETVIDNIYDFFGHGVRGAYNEFDTDWYEITDPQNLGLRGIFIEGFAWLFFGPSAGDPTRAETLERIRFEGPSDDADGKPRDEKYATTAEGITVGDTLADLQAAYPSASSGSNADEHYYRISDAGGTLCFYFGSSAPDADDTIDEIATECRS